MSQFSSSWYADHLARESARRPANPLRDCPPITTVTRESDLHSQIIADCRRRGWLWVHARMDKASHISIGAPDFLIMAEKGRVLLVECKRRLGKLSPDQQAFKAWAEKLGHRVHVVRSLEDFCAVADGKETANA
jgi:hypothetical protein